MGGKIIYAVKRMYSEGLELQGHRLAFVSATLGVVELTDGIVTVRQKHDRRTRLARLLDRRGRPIDGFEIHDAQVTKMTSDGTMMIYGTETDETPILKYFGQAWWCEPVEIIPTPD